jgi:hypothetical protein
MGKFPEARFDQRIKNNPEIPRSLLRGASLFCTTRMVFIAVKAKTG